MILPRQRMFSKGVTKAANREIRRRLGYKQQRIGDKFVVNYEYFPENIHDVINNRALMKSKTKGAVILKTTGANKSLRTYLKEGGPEKEERIKWIYDHGRRGLN